MNYQELICKLNNSTYAGRCSSTEDVGISVFLNADSILEIFRSGNFQLFNLNDTNSTMDKIIVKFLNQPKEKWFEGVNDEA